MVCMPAATFIRTDWTPDDPLVQLSDQYALPGRFTASIEQGKSDPICHMRLQVEGGRVVCDYLTLERRPGCRSLSGDDLRAIPVADYVRRAVDGVLHALVPKSSALTFTFPGHDEEYTAPMLPFDETRSAVRIVGLTYEQSFKVADSGSPTSEAVAAEYRGAHARGDHPTKAVMDRWPVSRSTASRWIRRARTEGLLPPATPRVAG